MAVRTYNADDVNISFRGNTITGFGPDTFVKIERNSDSFALVIGSAGEGARSKTNDRSGKVTFTLLQTSPSNDILSASLAEDEQVGTGQGALLVKDLSGSSEYEAQNAWVTKYAGAEYGRAVGTREWTLETDRIEMTVGGNS
jgi:hypothetical protein